jgi:RNA polymerase sigma-70 factor (family 1)
VEQCNDKQLIELIRKSDYHAFDELHRRFWKPLYIHAVKKTGSKEDAFDLVQDLFTDLWDKREKIPEIEAPLKYYLRSTVVFKIATYFRSKGFNERHFRDFEEFLKQQSFTTEHNLSQLRDDNLEFDALMEVVNNTIEEMPEKMRRIFLLSRSGQYSIAEIAESLQLSSQTVKNQTNNAMQRLRNSTVKFSYGTLQVAIIYWLMKS